jgi:hypothetical protein
MYMRMRTGNLISPPRKSKIVPPVVAYGLWLRNPLTAVLAIAVSVIPALFESSDPLGPYRRLLNSILVVVRLCIILVAVVVSPCVQL